MKIIDAHLHFVPGDEYFGQIATAAGHQNTVEHIREKYEKLGIVCGIVMGNRKLEPECHQYPEFMRYCIGIDSFYLTKHDIKDSYDQIEQNLKRDNCVGIKLYPGYSHIYVTDPVYDQVYELAEAYHKPVAIHTGETATPQALLKYSHPLTLDEAAVAHPNVQFVMCHFGNPWLMDAAAVVSKNKNVAVDISGLLEGHVDIQNFLTEKCGYVEALKTWLGYFGEYDKVMFGTDWPLVNLKEYIEFARAVVPEKYYEKVFFDNADRIYQLGLKQA